MSRIEIDTNFKESVANLIVSNQVSKVVYTCIYYMKVTILLLQVLETQDMTSSPEVSVR